MPFFTHAANKYSESHDHPTCEIELSIDGVAPALGLDDLYIALTVGEGVHREAMCA